MVRIGQRRLAAVAAVVAVATVSVPGVRAAGPGTLDTSFSGDGIARIDFGADDYAQAVLADSSGRLIVAGATKTGFDGPHRTALARLSADGRLDRSFWQDGKRIVHPTEGRDRPDAWAPSPDGTMVAVGRIARLGPGYYLMRFLPDGRIDRSFGDDGLVLNESGRRYDVVKDVLVLPSGRIIVLYEDDGVPLLHAYLRDGTRVTGFGKAGVARATVEVGETLVYQRTSKRILIAGAQGRRLVLEAFRTDGEREMTYGSRGWAAMDIGAEDGAKAGFIGAALALRDGRVVVAGAAVVSFRTDAVVGRFTENGLADTTFGGGDGWRRIDVGNIDLPRSMVVLPSGRLIVVGMVGEDAFGDDLSSDLFLVGLRRDGRLWEQFGDGGVVRTDFGDSDDEVAGHDAVLTGDKLVVVGTSMRNMLAARFLVGGD